MIKKLFSDLSEKQEEKKYIAAIAQGIGCDKNTAKQKLNMCQAANYSKDVYVNQKLYLVPDDKLKSLKRFAYVSAVADKYQMPLGEVYTIMNRARDQYGISHRYFASKNLMDNPTEEAFTAEGERIEARKARLIKSICDATGMTEEETNAELARIKKLFGFGAKQYYTFQMYKMTDEEIAAYKEKVDAEQEAQYKRVMEETGWSLQKTKNHMKRCNAEWEIDAEHYMYFRAWQMTDEELASYVTVRTSRELNKKYNEKNAVLRNKVRFNKTYKDYIQRKFWINDEDATFESFCEFTNGLDEIFCKALDLSRGRGTERVKLDRDLRTIYDEFMARPPFLAEEYIKQHSKMNEVYDGSVNTVRFVTLLKDGQCHALCSFVRFGNGGIIDGLGGGGMIAGVDVETGIIVTPAINGKGERVERHPASGVQFEGFQIPHWDKVREITFNAMHAVDYINYVGWDVAICEDKAIIVEGNSIPDLGAYQSPFALLNEGKKHIFTPYL